MKHHWLLSYGWTWWQRPPVTPSLVNVTGVRATGVGPEIIHCHEHWHMDCMLTPGMLMRVGERGPWVEKELRTWLLCPPRYLFHLDSAKAQTPTENLWMTFNGGDTVGLPAMLGKQGCAFFADPAEVLTGRVRELALRSASWQDAGYMLAQAGFYEILHLLVTAERKRDGLYEIVDNDPTRHADPLVKTVLDFIAACACRSITLAEVAAHTHSSIQTLERHFHLAFGEGIMKRHMRMRVDMVKRLLLLGDDLTAIAEQTGFCDPFHLSKTFKRHEGISPRTYLKQIDAARRSQKPPE